MSFTYTLFRRHWPVVLPTLLLVLSIGLRLVLPPTFIETYFSRGLFVGFRQLWGLLTGWAPIPLFYLFWLFVLTQVLALWRAAKQKKEGAGKTILFTFRQLFRFFSWLIIAFLWMWGFNYGRQTVTEQMNFSPFSPTLSALQTRVVTEAEELQQLRQQVSKDTAALTAEHFPSDWETTIQPLLVKALLKHGYPANGTVRGRQLYPKGLLLRWSTAGVYWPWVGEGHIDAGLLHLQKPAVMAHELAHAYGFGDEGVCNFWAYLAGEEATDPALQYAFRLSYWRRIASRWRRADPEAYAGFRVNTLDPGIINDLRAIYANIDKYPDFLPQVRDATYTAYLKAQGIQEGMLNYGKVVQLVEGYRKSYQPSR